MVGASNKRLKDVTILTVLMIFVGFANLIFPHYFLILAFERILRIIFNNRIYWLISISMVGRILGIIFLVMSWGLWNRKQWAYKGALIVAILEIVDRLVSGLLYPKSFIIDPYQVMRKGLMRYGGTLEPVIRTLVTRFGLLFIILFNIIINGIMLYYLTRSQIKDVFNITLPTDVLHLTALECFVGFYSILFCYYIYRAPLPLNIVISGYHLSLVITGFLSGYHLSLVITGFCSLVVGYGLWTLKNGVYQSTMILSIIGILTALFYLEYLYPVHNPYPDSYLDSYPNPYPNPYPPLPDPYPYPYLYRFLSPLLISQGIMICYLTQPVIRDIFRISDKSLVKLLTSVLFLVILVLPLAAAFVEGSWEEARQLYLAPIITLLYFPVYFCFILGFGLNSNLGCALGFLLGLSGPIALLVLIIKYSKDKWTVLIILQVYVLFTMIIF